MSGHSKFANIKHRKGAQDANRSKMFVKIAKEITVAVKKGGGPDPNSNSALRSILVKAKANNMPKDSYMKAIKKAAGAGDESNFTEISYEGFGPGGVAYIVDCLTDNHVRTAAKIRSYFKKCNGSLGQTNSVSYLFEKKGLIGFTSDSLTEDEVFEWVMENDGENLDVNDDEFLITCSVDNFEKMQKFIESKNIDSVFVSEVKWIAKDIVNPVGKDLDDNQELIDRLEDDEDVENFYHNLA